MLNKIGTQPRLVLQCNNAMIRGNVGIKRGAGGRIMRLGNMAGILRGQGRD
jgi:hypothetical protein